MPTFSIRRLRPLLGLLALGAVCASLVPAARGVRADEKDTEEHLERAWIETDLKMAAAVRAVAAPKDLSAKAFLEKLGEPDVRIDRKIGFGGRQLHVATHGGYTTTWIHAVLHDDRMVGLRMHFDPGREAWPVLEKRYTAALGKAFSRAKDGLHLTWWDADGFDRLRAATHEALGAPAESIVPEEASSAYALLTSPLHTYDFGSVCYEGGDAPEGRVAINALVAAKRWDLIGNVLRGLNPEGRVHAAEALLERARKTGKALPERDRAAVEKVRTLTVPISACSGCEVYDTTAAKLLAPQER